MVDEKVENLMYEFWRKYGIKPNAVYLGFKQMSEAKSSTKQYLWNNEDYGKSYFGMDVHHIDERDHLSVGVTIKQ